MASSIPWQARIMEGERRTCRCGLPNRVVAPGRAALPAPLPICFHAKPQPAPLPLCRAAKHDLNSYLALLKTDGALVMVGCDRKWMVLSWQGAEQSRTTACRQHPGRPCHPGLRLACMRPPVPLASLLLPPSQPAPRPAGGGRLLPDLAPPHAGGLGGCRWGMCACCAPAVHPLGFAECAAHMQASASLLLQHHLLCMHSAGHRRHQGDAGGGLQGVGATLQSGGSAWAARRGDLQHVQAKSQAKPSVAACPASHKATERAAAIPASPGHASCCKRSPPSPRRPAL